MWSKIALDPVELHLAAVLRCGQSFRWKQLDNDVWSICMQNRVLFVKQDTTHLFYRSEGPGNELDTLQIVRDYFNLDICLRTLYKDWIARDAKHFTSGHWGVRILRQDPWECLCSFICSANNNIKRITKMVDSLCTHFGDHVATIDGHPYHDFPTPAQLAKDPEQTEQILRELGFGYRAKYIANTALMMLQKPPTYLFDLRKMDSESCVAALTSFSGVGPKVADCVALMSLDKHEIVPIDTHMYQIANRNYKIHVTQGAKGYKEVQNRLAAIWGEHAGWAHSVLFAGDLPDLTYLKRSLDASEEQAGKRIKKEIENVEVEIKA